MTQQQTPPYPILVVDDEDAILLSIDTTLRMAGLDNIIICQDSRQVMDLFSRQPCRVSAWPGKGRRRRQA